MASDTQFSLEVQDGKKLKNGVAHLVSQRYKIDVEEDKITIAGSLGWAKQKQMTTLNLMILRVVMFTFGRFFPNLIRKLLQKILITGKKNAPFSFLRQLRWENGHWKVIDELNAESWEQVVSAGIGCDQTSIYVVMSRTFQRGQLRQWIELTDKIKPLKTGEKLIIERDF